MIDITRNHQVIQVYSSLVRSSNLKFANQNNNLFTTMIIDDPTIDDCRSVEAIYIRMITRFDRLILVFKNLSDFKHRIFRQSDARNRHTARNVKCRFCDDFFGSRKAVHDHEVQAHRELVNESEEYELSSEETRLRFTNKRYEIPAPVVVYADFESVIDDKNRHKPIMLSCLAVSRIPA